MTNKDKYLKDNVSVEELIQQLYDIQDFNYNTNMRNCKKFFEEEVKPTLTEDERVILRNIMFFTKIGKDKTSIYVSTEENSIYRLGVFNHLFQFIKERRRIRNKGVIR